MEGPGEGAGAELERALLELAGGVVGAGGVKLEPPEEPQPARHSSDSNKADPHTPERAPPADSLESPSAARGDPWTALKCVFCDQPLVTSDGSPKLMECLHSTCEGCVKAKIEEKHSGRDFLDAERLTITCAVCKIPCQPQNMIDQQFVVEKATADSCGNGGAPPAGEQHCNSCSDDNVATSWCVECAEFICDVCVQAHQRLKITKDHTIKSKEEATQEIQALTNSVGGANDMFCKEHTQERLSLFCETCDRLTCRDCQLLHHRDHKYQFSTEMAAQARLSISSLLSEVSYKRVLLGSAMEVIRKRQTLIADKKKDLVHEITQCVVKLTNTINTRGKQLVLRLNEVCDNKQKTLNEKKMALEQLSAITDHCIEFCNAALEQGSDTAVLYSKRQVTQHLQRIKSRRADIPNPEIPVRISLALEKVPDLIKVLSSIGGIVVDGKVDTSPSPGAPPPAASPHSQGPYHPPPAVPPGAPGVPGPSAVVALQQVAMQQGFVNNRSGGASPSGAPPLPPPPYNTAVISQLHHQVARHGQQNQGNVLNALAARNAPALLRHPHVTSTTHPHHMQGLNEINLRGLLNPTGQYVAQQQQQQRQMARHQLITNQQFAAYQQVMGAYAAGGAYAAAAAAATAAASNSSRSRSAGGPRTPSPAPPHVQYHPQQPQHAAQQPGAKWHIPQHGAQNGMYDGGSSPFLTGGAPAAPNNDFKITLNRQATAARQPTTPSAVTSTNPKTPSPSLNGGASSEATVSLDKLCQESVQDLMATIAKLDSNGVQVLPEAHSAPSAPGKGAAPSPHVHSSTDDPLSKTASAAAESNDPNEDWCAVCMDGGELMCCDKCPKVFHQYCHIPTIDKLPEETESWQCLLCVNLSELPPDSAPGDRRATGLTPRQQKLIERITLELYCQYEISLVFREPVPSENVDYHSKIACPMALDMIRMKLQPTCTQRYTHVSQFVADVRLLLRNAYSYNPPDSQFYKDAKRLEEFFDQQLEKWLPEYAYYDPGVDDDSALHAKRQRRETADKMDGCMRPPVTPPPRHALHTLAGLPAMPGLLNLAGLPTVVGFSTVTGLSAVTSLSTVTGLSTVAGLSTVTGLPTVPGLTMLTEQCPAAAVTHVTEDNNSTTVYVSL